MLAAKVYIFVSVCPVTKLLNLQVIESKSVDGIIDGLTRLGCEVGFPTFFLVDQDSAMLKVLKEAQVNLLDLQYQVKTQYGINFKTCPVSGHNMHGMVERRIRSVECGGGPRESWNKEHENACHRSPDPRQAGRE